MSTRCTISHDKHHHLYQECFEYDNVYLQLDAGEWAASLESEAIDWRKGEFNGPRLLLRVDVAMWRKIVEGWLASQWGQNSDEDHQKVELNLELTNRLLQGINDKTNEIEKEETP